MKKNAVFPKPMRAPEFVAQKVKWQDKYLPDFASLVDRIKNWRRYRRARKLESEFITQLVNEAGARLQQEDGQNGHNRP